MFRSTNHHVTGNHITVFTLSHVRGISLQLRDEFVVKERVFDERWAFTFLLEKTPESNEVMTIASGEVNAILFKEHDNSLILSKNTTNTRKTKMSRSWRNKIAMSRSDNFRPHLPPAQKRERTGKEYACLPFV